MSTTVTLNIFSGRPNPTWVLAEDESAELDARMRAITGLSNQKPTATIVGLGYRGFLVSRDREAPQGPLRAYVHEALLDVGPGQPSLIAPNRELETWLLGTGRQLAADVAGHVRGQLRAQVVPQAATLTADAVGCATCQAADAPPYNPGKWNVPSVQPYNNCYNYANDQITGTFAQPGRAHGSIAASMVCRDVDGAAKADVLRGVPGVGSPLATGQGWYVALVVWPGNDYHWYRQDDVGCWSHKPGSTAARNVDNAGATITDPATCNRGPYTDFCGYYVTDRGVVIS